MAFPLSRLVEDVNDEVAACIAALNSEGIFSAIDVSLLDDDDIFSVAGDSASIALSITRLH
jgi:hypothetical protein